MTVKEFRAKQKRFSRSQREFSALLGCSIALVSGMATGRHPITQGTVDKIEALERGVAPVIFERPEMTPEEFHVKQQQLSKTRKEFAAKLRVSADLVAGMISGHHKVSPKTIDKIANLEKEAQQLQNDGQVVLFERQQQQDRLEATTEIVAVHHVPITVEMPNGFKLTLKGTLRGIVKQLRTL